MAIGLSGHHTTTQLNDDRLIVELELDGLPDADWIDTFLGFIEPNPTTPPVYEVDRKAIRFQTTRIRLQRSFELVTTAIRSTNSTVS